MCLYMWKRVQAFLMAFGLIFLVAGCGPSLSQQNKHEVITIQAAASLKEAMTEIANNFKQSHHLSDDQIAINFAGSGTLRQQIETGAPANIFVSADEKNMQMLQDKNLVSDVQPLLKNELVLITPQGHSSVTMASLGQQDRIVIGNVDTVPAGRYAKQVLEHSNLWNGIQSKLVYAKDVRAVTAYISQGAGDVGFVYKTDAMAAGDKVVISDMTPDDSHDAVIYPIAMVKKYDTPLSHELYEYLQTPEAQAVFSKYGFTPAK